MLKMKKACERCGTATGLTAVAYICSFECNFCEPCCKEMNAMCPNCQGNLVLRPTRLRHPAAVAASRVVKKLLGS